MDWLGRIDAAKAELFSEAGLTDPTPGPRENDPDNPLIRLGEIYKPSKRAHNYLPRYDHVFGRLRHDVRTFVEIGVQTDRSVQMWRDYFPNARIIGVDIDPNCKAYESDRIEIVIGDQTDPVFLKAFAAKYAHTIDIIVDDGLHTEQAIMTSFSYLYPALAPYGIYAIEDIIRQPGVDDFVKQAIDAIQYWPEDVPAVCWQALSDFGEGTSWFVRNTIGVEVYRYVAFIKRGFNPTGNPYALSPDYLFSSQNAGLAEVRAIVAEMEARGETVTREALIERIGFHKRHFVHWHMGGLRRPARSLVRRLGRMDGGPPDVIRKSLEHRPARDFRPAGQFLATPVCV